MMSGILTSGTGNAGGLGIFTDIAVAAVAILVTVLAIYLALKLLGKIAKFMVGVVIVAAILWFLFSDHSILQSIGAIGDKIPSFSEIFAQIRDAFARIGVKGA